jgi:hypothetical protein
VTLNPLILRFSDETRALNRCTKLSFPESHRKGRKEKGDSMSAIQSVLGVVGGVATTYFAVRVAATVYDILGRWKRNDW